MVYKTKAVVCLIGVLIALILMPVGCLHYEMNYKKTIRDKSLSADKVYELTLIEIGEPVWPFGPAAGRLVLKEGNTTISQTDFELRNDGCCIGSNDWTITWNEDHAEVILSGEEQFDEQILLYFDGTTQRQTLTDETEQTEAQPEVEILALDISVIENRENELVFDISVDDFIESYNSLYFRDESREYLLPKSEWRKFTYDDAIHSDHETSLLEFTVDERIWSQPTIMDGGSVIHYEKYKVLDWELTERGNFYYRIYPAGDKHYSDYALIRMVEPDLELCDLTMKYIWAGGYVGTNIFLIDWTEDDFGDLSFNDLFESLYYDCNGNQFSPEGYEYIIEQDCCMIPAAEFEAVVRPYFDIDMEVFREMARYDVNEDTYPWRQIQTNDFVFLYYYMVEPEVTEYKVNSDGTITLTVEMLSTDLATDCLFAHELTVRPLDNGKFQFVGNRITYQTEYGLPFCEPRLTWNAR